MGQSTTLGQGGSCRYSVHCLLEPSGLSVVVMEVLMIVVRRVEITKHGDCLHL
jgi:hypothetical protein